VLARNGQAASLQLTASLLALVPEA